MLEDDIEAFEQLKKENPIKVSFDFDGTLSEEEVEEYAAKLIDEDSDIEVWIVTARLSGKEAPEDKKHLYEQNNKDISNVAERIGIPKERIIFTEMDMKSDYLKNKGFLWHLDDCQLETNYINTHTETFGIVCRESNNWLNKCEYLLGNGV